MISSEVDVHCLQEVVAAKEREDLLLRQTEEAQVSWNYTVHHAHIMYVECVNHVIFSQEKYLAEKSELESQVKSRDSQISSLQTQLSSTEVTSCLIHCE